MDVATVDATYSSLQQQAQQTTQAIQTLAGKLQAAATAGDQNAREWLLDLKEVALGVRDEEGQVNTLLQAIHSMVDTHVQAAPVAPQYQQQAPQYQQPQYQQAPQQYAAAGGGILHSLLGSGFGRAIATGAGFGIGDDLIRDIF